MNYAGKFDAKSSVAGLGVHVGDHAHVDSVSPHTTHAPADAIIVPDAQLLFNGDFKRSGVDLILSKDDQELVLHDYFKGEKRAALSSPDGAHLTGDIVKALAGHVEYAQADGSASVSHVIGHVTKLAGTATAIRNGVSIILNQGDNVEKGDVVQSGSGSTLGITFIDGTVFGLSSNARMVLNEMVYDPNASNNSSLLSLVAGTITFIAGDTAKHGDMKVDTPVATMGIRGTAVLVEIDFDVGGQGGLPDAKFQVLVEPDGTTGSYILFDKVTLTPFAIVDRAGLQFNFSNGNLSQSTTGLSSEIQKLITDVFSIKFTDSNTKTLDHYTDALIPNELFPIKVGDINALPIVFNLHTSVDTAFSNSVGPPDPHVHTNQAPTAVILNANGQPATGFQVTELPGVTHSSALDTASATVSFVDINVGDAPTVSTKFDSFTYENAAHANVTATLSAQQLADIAAVENKLIVVADPNNSSFGSATWTYSVADGSFDFLAAGETLTLTYDAFVNNNYLPSDQVTEVKFTITIIGTNDLPTITASSGEILRPPSVGAIANDTVSGIIKFTDADLTDRPVASATFSSLQVFDAQNHDVTSTLTASQLAAAQAVEVPLVIQQGAGNTNNGSANWTYSVADQAFNFLAPGETLVLDYTAQINDGHGGLVSQLITVAVTEPLLGSAVLAAGVDTNSLGLPTETFAGVVPGSISNNGAGHGDFYSVTLDAMFSGSGNAGVVNGSGPNSLAPFVGPSPGQADTSDYLSVGAFGSETITFATEQNAFGLYWGSVDSYNTLSFYNGAVLVASYTGAEILPMLAGNPGNFADNGYVEFANLGSFNEVVLGSGANAFEVTNISSGTIASGVTEIASGANLAITGANTTTAIAFEGAGGTLTISGAALDTSLNFTPTISGLDASDFIDFQGTVTSAFFNSGVLTLLDGNDPVAYLHLAGDYSNDAFTVATIGSNLSQIVDPPATHATIASGGVLEVNSASTENVTFESVAGTLQLDQPSVFQGQIAGLSGVGDVLDLAGIGIADTAISVTFNAQNDTTVLATYDPQNHQMAQLTLDGDYSAATFNATSDGSGGINIQEAPAQITIASGETIAIASAGISAENVTFQNSTGNLTLDNPSNFNGVISGFAGNGAQAGSDQIDLKGINYNSSSFSESYNSTTDALSVSDGTNSTVLHFTGTYQAADFSFQSDGSGGTIVYDPPVSSAPAPTMIVASAPNQTLTGNAASDNFVFNFANVGQATVTDFHPATDVLQFNSQLFANIQAALNATHDDGHGNTVVALDAHDTITLSGVVKAQLHASDFHFV